MTLRAIHKRSYPQTMIRASHKMQRSSQSLIHKRSYPQTMNSSESQNALTYVVTGVRPEGDFK